MWMRACECCIKVSGVYRQSGYIYTNYDLLVMHAIYCDIIVFKYVRPDTTENIKNLSLLFLLNFNLVDNFV